jgi:hypothetical protein
LYPGNIGRALCGRGGSVFSFLGGGEWFQEFLAPVFKSAVPVVVHHQAGGLSFVGLAQVAGGLAHGEELAGMGAYGVSLGVRFWY